MARSCRTSSAGGGGDLFSGHLGLVALALAFAVLWAFLLGGVIETLTRPEGPRYLDGFAGACGRSFGRFLILVAASSVFYWLIFKLSGWLYGRLAEATREITAERTVLFWAVLIAALIVGLLHLVRMVFDYAKIAVVTSDAGALQAFASGVRFVAARPRQTIAVYAALTLLALAVAALYAVLAPGAGLSTWWTVLAAFLVAQVYLVGRIGLRVALLGAQARLYRRA